MSKKPETSTLDEVREAIDLIRRRHRVIYVDPGVGGTGYAVFDSHAAKRIIPDTYSCIKSDHESWQDRMIDVCQQFHGILIDVMVPDIMVIEWPELWTGSDRSQASAARGDLVKLSALCGALLLEASNRLAYDSLLVTARDWKGQLSKPAVQLRIRRVNGETYPNHVEDAVGMGLAVMGVL